MLFFNMHRKSLKKLRTERARRAKMYRTVTTKKNHERIQKPVIILYHPRPKGPVSAGSGNGFDTAKGNIFSSQHTVKQQNSLPHDFVGVKKIRWLKKNQTPLKKIDPTMPKKHWDLMETSRPGHSPKFWCWNLSWELRDAAALGMSLLLVHWASDAGLSDLDTATQGSYVSDWLSLQQKSPSLQFVPPFETISKCVFIIKRYWEKLKISQ